MSRRPANREHPSARVWLAHHDTLADGRRHLRNRISRFPDGQYQHPVGTPNKTLSPMLAAQLAKKDGFA
jgi:hypothetical protein